MVFGLRKKKYFNVLRLQILLIAILDLSSKKVFSQSHDPPVPQFKDLYQQIDSKSTSRCQLADSFGCGEIITVGSMAKSAFTFKDLFVSCGVTQNGIFIRMQNSLSNQATMQMLINIWHTSSPPKVKICKGIVKNDSLESESNAIESGSCELLFKVHNNVLAAMDNRQCLIVFNNAEGEPWKGSIHCQMLEQFGKYVLIDERSSFQCPAS